MSANQNLDALRALRALPENRYGYAARWLNIIYGLARGIPISRIESDRSDPHAFPDVQMLADAAASYHRPQAEGESTQEHLDKVNTFKAGIVSDLAAWKRDRKSTRLNSSH